MNITNDIIKIVDVIDGIPQFVKKEIECIPEFTKVMSRIRKCKGDSDGRKKHLNRKELLYVKYMAEADSLETLYSNFRGEKRHQKAKEDTGLPKNWMPDSVIQDAINKYIEIQTTYVPTIKLLNALEQGMFLSSDAVEGQLTQMETAMATANKLADMLKTATDVGEAKETMNSMLETTKLVQANVKQFMTMIADIPKALDRIDELRNRVILEKTGERQKRGGHSKGRREDPKNK